MKKRIKVRCTIDVFIEGEFDDNGQVSCYVEENSCPGTGKVGCAIDEAINFHDDNGSCWACAMNGKNTVLEIIDLPNEIMKDRRGKTNNHRI